MPVTSEHPQYSQRKSQWARCRDVIGGTDAVKNATTLYLPKLSGQDDNEYSAFLKRALFYNATDRTVQGLHGAVFRKDYVADYPFEDDLDDITPDGLDLLEFSRLAVLEVLSVSRMGALVDVPKEGGERAYVAIYKTEHIINWGTEKIDGELRLTMVVLREMYADKDPSDPFTAKMKEQYRVLRLNNVEGQRFYEQQVWRKADDDRSDSWAVVPELGSIPTRNGQRLDFIPFQFINNNDLTTKCAKPMILDLVDVNLSHYRTSADLEHGAHFTALPTAYACGFTTDQAWRIGSSVAWTTSNENAKVGMLEYTGQGLGALTDLKKDKEQMMAVLGARMLEDQKRAVEAEGTQRLRRSGETGALAGTVTTVSSGIKKLLEWMAAWRGASDQQINEIDFQLNTDFYDVEMAPQLLDSLMKALQSGSISQDTFLYNLKVGEILPPGRTIDDEKDLIDSEADSMSAGQEPPLQPAPMKRQLNIVRDSSGKAVSVEEQ